MKITQLLLERKNELLSGCTLEKFGRSSTRVRVLTHTQSHVQAVKHIHTLYPLNLNIHHTH